MTSAPQSPSEREANQSAPAGSFDIQLASLARLHELAMELGRPLDLQRSLDAILEAIVELHCADYGLLSIYDRTACMLREGASIGFDPAAIASMAHIVQSPDAGACGSAFATRTRAVIYDTEADPRFDSYRESARAAGFRAVHSTPIFTRSGDIVGVLSVQFKQCRQPSALEMQLADICARHAADIIEAASHQEALRENERRYRHLIQALPAAIYATDAKGHVTLYNEAAIALWGREPNIGEDQWCGSLRMFQPDGSPLPLDCCPMAMAIKECRSMHGVEAVVERPDGSRRHVLAHPQLIYDEQGAMTGAINVLVDITERKQMENELRRINGDLEEFAYVTSHDLQEPLRMVNIYAQKLLEHQSNPDAEALQCMEFVQTGIRRMEQLIRDLLSYSHTIREEEHRPRPVNLRASFEQARAILEMRIRESGAQFTVASLPTVMGEETQMALLFQNLLSNAIKYSKAGEPPQIRVAAERRGSEWVVAVRDNGIGFDPKYADRIFGLFKRLHRDRYIGTGLGLAICKRIVERYGGHIWAESEPGAGSVFCFVLPAASE